MNALTLPIQLPRGPEHYWRMACEIGAAGFTVGDLAGCTNGVAYGTVQQWVNAMKRQGELKIVGERDSGVGGRSAHVYAVVQNRRVAPVVRRASFTGDLGRRQQYLWSAMRILRQFTIAELAYSASTDEVVILQNTARKYVAALEGAGVLVTVRQPAAGKKGQVGAQPGAWRLRKSCDTGPKAPQIFEAKFVFDPNKSRIVGPAEVSQ